MSWFSREVLKLEESLAEGDISQADFDQEYSDLCGAVEDQKCTLADINTHNRARARDANSGK